ncbi:DNA polymerase beta [Thiocystis minor]|uniref:nucleotidyltransferase domain-containing protein n=1 Tax=Thiocystis minor TaxID=61597 RepID=UPI00191311B8|nr:nucleotidyltransferase domain-containing protein [Thiocystis minor]MBK5966555.1 DNA polymerase beta [Thiocystis minor]
MRLSRQQIASIRNAAEDAFGPDTRVTLFGSRVDDNKRGGDIDLLIRPTRIDQPFVRKLRFLSLLERNLGERKIDVVMELPNDSRPIVQVAHVTGVAL